MDDAEFQRLKKIGYTATHQLMTPQWATEEDMAMTAVMVFIEYCNRTKTWDIDPALTHVIMRRRTIDYLRTTGDYFRDKDKKVQQELTYRSQPRRMDIVLPSGTIAHISDVMRAVDENYETKIEQLEEERELLKIIRKKIQKHRDYRAASMIAMTLDGITQTSIAEVFGITESRVSQIMKKVLA